MGTAATLTLAWGTYQAYKWLDHRLNQVDIDQQEEVKEQSLQTEKKKKPPYCGQKLGNDQTKCPGEGFEWKGNGTPETGFGSWVKNANRPTQETLHPDINHRPPKAPHWDYHGPEHLDGAELYLDGTWKLKGKGN